MSAPHFPSRRSAVLARQGMVATSQPLAALAGLRILMDGGNAADAAVTVAAMLNVVEPMSTGIGGDCFALIYEAQTGQVTALNGSGRAPCGFTADEARRRGLQTIPLTGPLPVTDRRAGHLPHRPGNPREYHPARGGAHDPGLRGANGH